MPAQGGSQVTIAGTGLPLNVADAVLSICGQTVAAKSTNNIATVFIMPSCAEGAQTLTYTFGSYSGTVSITVTAASTSMEITSISPTSSSPSEKGVLDINGNNFPTDISTISVSLVGATKTYQMKVLSSTGTLVKAGIPGGIEGAYKVVLTVGSVNAVANPASAVDFAYKIPLTGISPLTGSHFGGTLITIDGANFSPSQTDMMVSVGLELNTVCRIETIS